MIQEDVFHFTPRLVAACVAVALAILAALLWATSSGKRARPRSTVLLVGPSEAGKTALATRLTTGTFPSAPGTFTSLSANRAPLPPTGFAEPGDAEEETLTLLDTPGQERLQSDVVPYLREHRALASVLVVVDAVAVQRPEGLRAAGERLYVAIDGLRPGLLEESAPSKRRGQGLTIPIILVASKSDVMLAAGPDKVASVLTEELHRLRVSRAASLSTLQSTKGGGGGNRDAMALRHRRAADALGPTASLSKLDLQTDIGVEVMSVSAKSGVGIDALLDRVHRSGLP